jgi:hypothetical protein
VILVITYVYTVEHDIAAEYCLFVKNEKSRNALLAELVKEHFEFRLVSKDGLLTKRLRSESILEIIESVVVEYDGDPLLQEDVVKLLCSAGIRAVTRCTFSCTRHLSSCAN